MSLVTLDFINVKRNYLAVLRLWLLPDMLPVQLLIS